MRRMRPTFGEAEFVRLEDPPTGFFSPRGHSSCVSSSCHAGLTRALEGFPKCRCVIRRRSRARWPLAREPDGARCSTRTPYRVSCRSRPAAFRQKDPRYRAYETFSYVRPVWHSIAPARPISPRIRGSTQRVRTTRSLTCLHARTHTRARNVRAVCRDGMTWADTDTWCVRARCDAFSFFSLLLLLAPSSSSSASSSSSSHDFEKSFLAAVHPSDTIFPVW